jgi:Uncharacterized protein conserved in bacteria
MAVVENLWLVDFDRAAVMDLEDVKSRGDRKAVFSAIDKLEYFGPRLSSPNMKSLKGAADLFELRPKQGRCAVRLIYARNGRRFVVLAVAPNKGGFDRALDRARKRLERRKCV